MGTLGIPVACRRSAMQLSYVSQSPGGLPPGSSSRRQTEQPRVSLRAFQRVRSTSFPVVPGHSPNSPIDDRDCLLGSSTFRVERLPSEKRSLSGLDLELMRELTIRRMIRADKEPDEKDVGEELDKTNNSSHRIWLNRARNLRTTAQVFCSMMFWIALFFIASIMDSEDQPMIPRGNRGRRR